MSLSILAVDQAARNLLDCVCEGLAALPAEVPGLAGCPCRVMLVPGTPAADGCDQSCGPFAPGEYPGQLTVNVVRIYSTTRDRFPLYAPSSPDSVQSTKRCAPPILAVDLSITLFRCTPLPSDEGCPPSPADLNESALQQHADMLAVYRAIQCCYAATDTTQFRGRRYTIGEAVAQGPQGGCVGFSQVVTVALDDCITCPPEAP